MGHELEFKLTEAHIDSLGFPLGEKYAINKINEIMKKEENPLKKLLIIVLIEIIMTFYKPIAFKVIEVNNLKN